jgi:hypothetical protein
MKKQMDHKSVSREKDGVPSILIEDPKRQTTYFIPGKTLQNYLINNDSLPELTPGTVIFVLPNEQDNEQIQPFIDPEEESPSILIQDRVNEQGYYFDSQQLKDFEIDLSFEFDDTNTVTFIIPFGWDLIENLPIVLKKVGTFHQTTPTGRG